MKRLCVFCGSRTGDKSSFAEQTRRFGVAMTSRNLELVFGAGHVGLMGILADTVLMNGGTAIGVIPTSLVERELAHDRLTQLHVVETMHQRKALMADLSDAFVALPGGYGTVDELFEILTWAQLRLHTKPIGLLNIEGFFDPLLLWLERAVHDGFLKPKHRALLQVADQPDTLLDLLSLFQDSGSETKWDQPDTR